MFNEELIAAKVAARNAGKILIKHLNVDDKNIEYKTAIKLWELGVDSIFIDNPISYKNFLDNL